jgi:hypothetical protein
MAINIKDRHYGESAHKKLWERKIQLETELNEVNFMLRATERLLKPTSEAKLEQLAEARARKSPDSSGISE